MEKPVSITRTLISVFDKTGLLPLAAFLKEKNVLILSTGGTARFLMENNISVTEISTLTQFPEILDGRVKTLNSRLYAGILCDRDKSEHLRTLEDLDLAPIDLVVVNLYPFVEVAKKTDDLSELIENIDIGGPSMQRAAAKNHRHVSILSSPSQYEEFMEHYAKHQSTDLPFRQKLAQEAFCRTSAYDRAIESTLSKRFNQEKKAAIPAFSFERSLRYGENPHQKAELYSAQSEHHELSLAHLDSAVGKELSYNNFLDTNAAMWSLRCLMDEDQSGLCGAIVIKHGIPCGASLKNSQDEALSTAIASDEKSAFGGVIALSHECDASTAAIIAKGFYEVLIAPRFSTDALSILHKKPNMRLLSLDNLLEAKIPSQSLRSIFGGVLVQEHDSTLLLKDQWTTVTKRKASRDEMAAMEFAYRMVIPTPSNAITLATNSMLLGVGAGQPNRVQSSMLAIEGALSRGFELKGAALASDAFFPFDDSVRLAHKHGISLIIQPGGSMRDDEVIKAADELGVCMVLTHRRHFKH